MILLIFIETLLLALGFIMLSLSMQRHYKQVARRGDTYCNRLEWLLRLSGYCILIISGALALNVWGIALGIVYWCAIATLVTLLLSFVLTYTPHKLRFIVFIMTYLARANKSSLIGK